MILPRQDGARNKLGRKALQEAVARAQGRKTKKSVKKRRRRERTSRREGQAVPTMPSLNQLERVNRNAAGIDLERGCTTSRCCRT
jgi:hypothetical protein